MGWLSLAFLPRKPPCLPLTLPLPQLLLKPSLLQNSPQPPLLLKLLRPRKPQHLPHRPILPLLSLPPQKLSLPQPLLLKLPRPRKPPHLLPLLLTLPLLPLLIPQPLRAPKLSPWLLRLPNLRPSLPLSRPSLPKKKARHSRFPVLPILKPMS